MDYIDCIRICVGSPPIMYYILYWYCMQWVLPLAVFVCICPRLAHSIYTHPAPVLKISSMSTTIYYHSLCCVFGYPFGYVPYVIINITILVYASMPARVPASRLWHPCWEWESMRTSMAPRPPSSYCIWNRLHWSSRTSNPILAYGFCIWNKTIRTLYHTYLQYSHLYSCCCPLFIWECLWISIVKWWYYSNTTYSSVWHSQWSIQWVVLPCTLSISSMAVLD